MTSFGTDAPAPDIAEEVAEEPGQPEDQDDPVDAADHAVEGEEVERDHHAHHDRVLPLQRGRRYGKRDEHGARAEDESDVRDVRADDVAEGEAVIPQERGDEVRHELR